MGLTAAVITFMVGWLAGVVVRIVAGLAAVVALILVLLGITSPEIGIVDSVLQQYYYGNELLFLSGLFFGIETKVTAGEVIDEPSPMERIKDKFG